jgi:hypothetical protein
MINTETRLDFLKSIGVDSVGDIELTEWLEYVKHTCISILKDKQACGEMNWDKPFTEATLAIDKAIEQINIAMGSVD